MMYLPATRQTDQACWFFVTYHAERSFSLYSHLFQIFSQASGSLVVPPLAPGLAPLHPIMSLLVILQYITLIYPYVHRY